MKTITLRHVRVACQSRILLPTTTFQDIDFVIPEKFNGSIELVGVSLSSLLPQTKKQKEIQIQSVYSMSRMHFKKPKFFLTKILFNQNSFYFNTSKLKVEFSPTEGE